MSDEEEKREKGREKVGRSSRGVAGLPRGVNPPARERLLVARRVDGVQDRRFERRDDAEDDAYAGRPRNWARECFRQRSCWGHRSGTTGGGYGEIEREREKRVGNEWHCRLFDKGLRRFRPFLRE